MTGIGRHVAVALSLTLVSCVPTDRLSAPELNKRMEIAHSVAPPQVVISQVYGGGGNSGATYNADYVELFNRGGATVAIGGWRLLQRKPVRHAINGLVGIAIGALIAWRTGEARDFYLPGIIQSYAFAAALLISAAVRQPIVGWGYSVIMAGGRSDWRKDPLMLRTFTWLTVVWALVWIAKVSVQAWLYLDKQDDLLGVARLVLGMPPYVLLIALTVWVVRRVTRNRPPVALEG
jgi:hypothetical protein